MYLIKKLFDLMYFDLNLCLIHCCLFLYYCLLFVSLLHLKMLYFYLEMEFLLQINLLLRILLVFDLVLIEMYVFEIVNFGFEESLNSGFLDFLYLMKMIRYLGYLVLLKLENFPYLIQEFLYLVFHFIYLVFLLCWYFDFLFACFGNFDLKNYCLGLLCFGIGFDLKNC